MEKLSTNELESLNGGGWLPQGLACFAIGVGLGLSAPAAAASGVGAALWGVALFAAMDTCAK